MKASQMQVSDNGTNFVKKWEGLYLKAYKDIVGVWTIGYGNTKNLDGSNIRPNQQLVGEWEAHKLLQWDLETHMRKPKTQITIDLNQNQYDAIASFCFNLGENILTGTNLLEAINKGDWNRASEIMLLYRNAGGQFVQGLYNRRKDEVRLMMNPNQPEGQPINPPDETPESGGYDSSWFTKQDGTFAVDRAVKLRTSPFPNREDNVLATLQSGDKVTYDSFGYEVNGYVWLRQPREGGKFGYIASGDTVNGKRVSTWGSFE